MHPDWLACFVVLVLFSVSSFTGSAADLRIGIIGCDTSHVIEFTEALNNPNAKDHVAGGRIVAAFKGGSMDIASSSNRLEGYSKKLQEKYGVKMCDSIEDFSIGIVGAGGRLAHNMPGPNKAGDVIDMPVGMVVLQACIEPDDLLGT